MRIETIEGHPSTWRDWIGITASVGCAIHCAAMPFVIAYLPQLGLNFLADEAFHKWMFLACVLIGVSAFLPGLKLHRNLLPVAVGSVGLGLIGYAAFALEDECCAACAKVEAETQESTVAEASCCENGCCTHASESIAEEAMVKDVASDSSRDILRIEEPAVERASLLTLFAPWVTPLGGFVLVSGHLLNRRYGCQCSCCQSACPTEPVTVKDDSPEALVRR